MMSIINNKIDIILKILLLSFPILIILGPFALNCFSIIFSLYAIFNYKKFKIFNKKIFFIFFSFTILIFPYGSIEFENSFFKFLSFFRFVLMFFGLIIFFERNNKENNFFIKIYKAYVVILVVIIIDILKENFFGSNLLGFSSIYDGRIASFTNDELIIGYIFCFLILFTIIFIYKKTNHYYFFVIVCTLLIVSFIIGERSNFIKLFLLILFFSLIHFFYLNKSKIKNILLITPVIFILSISFYGLTKDTSQGKKFYRFSNELFVLEENKFSFKIKEKFYNSQHGPHYLTAYKIFLNYPIFGIGINNFYLESKKNQYVDKKLKWSGGSRASTHPHQVYLEIISEVGLIGLIYFIFIFFYPVYISLKTLIKTKKINVLSHLLLHIYFIFPILPSGSFFGTNNGVPFWFNLAILLYLSKKNIKFYN
jgi:O-antigen ligase